MRIIYNSQFMGEIYLHRSLEKPDFDDNAMFILQLLQPHVSNIFHIIHTVTAVQFLEEKPSSVIKGICVFDEELSLTGGNAAGVEILKSITVYGSSVLYHVKELCMDIAETQITGQKEAAPSYQTSLIKMPGNVLKVDIFTKPAEKVKENFHYVVLMEFSNKDMLAGEYKLKFSNREAEIIDGLIQGKNNAQLAASLHLSENTIKTHIKNIYKKSGTSSRAELTYMLMLNKA